MCGFHLWAQGTCPNSCHFSSPEKEITVCGIVFKVKPYNVTFGQAYWENLVTESHLTLRVAGKYSV